MDLDDGVLTQKDRKLRNKLFRSIQNGDFDSDEYEELFNPARTCFISSLMPMIDYS